MKKSDTIVALSTPSGIGAIAVIRISGPQAFSIIESCFISVRQKKINFHCSYKVQLGYILKNDKPLDQVLITIFNAPYSYTSENVIEISCHGSPFIQREIINLLVDNGCRVARPGEFTQRAFLNGKMDLSQAEAVADLIYSENKASHQIAMQQMRGGFKNEIKELRHKLMEFAALIELELDFSEEDVEFANRNHLNKLLKEISTVIEGLIISFSTGNAIKTGVPVAIIGAPNVGKSTLLNTLLNEDKAIVSDIPGTTRDAVEDVLNIEGIGFRFIDTAGLREAKNIIESMGINITYDKIEKSQVIIYMIDAKLLNTKRLQFAKDKIGRIKDKFPEKRILVVANKIDLIPTKIDELFKSMGNVLQLSAKNNIGVDKLKQKLLQFVNMGRLNDNTTIVTNARHYDALKNAHREIEKAKAGLIDNLSGDLLAIDIKQAIYYLGEITGEITSDELLDNIFLNFCIGK